MNTISNPDSLQADTEKVSLPETGSNGAISKIRARLAGGAMLLSVAGCSSPGDNGKFCLSESEFCEDGGGTVLEGGDGNNDSGAGDSEAGDGDTEGAVDGGAEDASVGGSAGEGGEAGAEGGSGGSGGTAAESGMGGSGGTAAETGTGGTAAEAGMGGTAAEAGMGGTAAEAGTGGTAAMGSGGDSGTGGNPLVCDEPCGERECCDRGECRSNWENPFACGEECVVCPPDQPNCINGACGDICGADSRLCKGKCINVQNDPNNCGGCNIKCATGKQCVNKKCV